MGESTIGVALCTFNGARYIEAQLDSLSAQSRRPDVVCIADDGSTDATLEAVMRWTRRAPFEVIMLQPEGGQLGPTLNFERAVRALPTDLVAFCDQDDVWQSDKLAQQARALERDSGATVVFCDARLVDAHGSPLGKRLWGSLGFRCPPTLDMTAQVVPWLVRRTIAFGLTMMVRRRVFDVGLPFGTGWGHDNWTALVAVGLGRAVLIDAALLDYRQHGNQVSGGSTSLRPALTSEVRHGLQITARSYADLGARLEAANAAPFITRAVREKGEHLARRESMTSGLSDGIGIIVSELAAGRYWTFSNGARSIAVDVVRVLRSAGQKTRAYALLQSIWGDSDVV